MLIDSGNSLVIMFLGTYRRIGLIEETIKEDVELLVRFDGRPSSPIGSIALTVIAVEKLLHVQFTVVDAISTYNAILGQSWIHRMEGMASTLHQIFRCETVNGKGVTDIYGDQPTAKHCASFALKQIKKNAKQTREGTEKDLMEQGDEASTK